jgi:hypothetical protein
MDSTVYDPIGDDCSISACYTGCTGSSPPCPNPVVEPILGCVKASSYWRLKITNTNSEADSFTVDGVFKEPFIIRRWC